MYDPQRRRVFYNPFLDELARAVPAGARWKREAELRNFNRLVQHDARGWKARVDALLGVAPEQAALGRASGAFVRQHSADLKHAVAAVAAARPDVGRVGGAAGLATVGFADGHADGDASSGGADAAGLVEPQDGDVAAILELVQSYMGDRSHEGTTHGTGQPALIQRAFERVGGSTAQRAELLALVTKQLRASSRVESTLLGFELLLLYLGTFCVPHSRIDEVESLVDEIGSHADARVGTIGRMCLHELHRPVAPTRWVTGIKHLPSLAEIEAVLAATRALLAKAATAASAPPLQPPVATSPPSARASAVQGAAASDAVPAAAPTIAVELLAIGSQARGPLS